MKFQVRLLCSNGSIELGNIMQQYKRFKVLMPEPGILAIVPSDDKSARAAFGGENATGMFGQKSKYQQRMLSIRFEFYLLNKKFPRNDVMVEGTLVDRKGLFLDFRSFEDINWIDYVDKNVSLVSPSSSGNYQEEITL